MHECGTTGAAPGQAPGTQPRCAFPITKLRSQGNTIFSRAVHVAASVRYCVTRLAMMASPIVAVAEDFDER
jgi:hypothetical protein